MGIERTPPKILSLKAILRTSYTVKTNISHLKYESTIQIAKIQTHYHSHKATDLMKQHIANIYAT